MAGTSKNWALAMRVSGETLRCTYQEPRNILHFVLDSMIDKAAREGRSLTLQNIVTLKLEGEDLL